MAAASLTVSNINSLGNNSKSETVTALKYRECSFLRVDRAFDLRFTSKHDQDLSHYRGILVIRKAIPEAAAATGDAVSGALSIPGIPFSIPSIDNLWMAAFAGLFVVGVPFIIQRLLSLSKKVDMTAESIEKIADTVGKVAEEVDKAAEELEESLPEGGLKQMAALVEDMAEETVEGAQEVENLMDKVGELDDKLEALYKQKIRRI